MGYIKTQPKLDIMGKQTQQLDLEIIYGGKEAPFGGLDSSAPPQYIAPNCFTSANNFMVTNEQLVACGFFQLNITLAQWLTLNPIYLGSGSFYANGKYNNFALGYTTQSNVGPPTSQTVTYYIWVWNSGTTGSIPLTATLPITQTEVDIAATPAQAVIQITGIRATAGGTATVTVAGTPVNTTINPGDSALTVAANILANLNAGLVGTATASIDSTGLVITITTVATGVGANATTLTVNNTNAFTPHVTISSPFQGALNAFVENFGIPINPLSWVAIGETLYLGGAGSMILQYSNDPTKGIVFSALTQYLGAVTLNKFSGYLIAGGVVPGPGTVIQDAEMVIAWSANGQYGIWNPVDSSGNVTGAGFNQEGDISDYITGFFIMNTTAIVLRTQGIDYLSSLGSGVQPFDFNHISLAKLGEGCQDSRLVSQYDQIGFFVGNTDVFEYSGGLREIGAKIRQLLIPSTQNPTVINRWSSGGPVTFGNISTDVIGFFLIDLALYTYNSDNKTWMQFTFAHSETQPDFLAIENWASAAIDGSAGAQFNNSRQTILVTQAKQGIAPFHSQPVFWQLQSFVQNVDFVSSKLNTSGTFVTFPAEEVDFGKDITIDGFYVSLVGQPGQVINFTVNGILKGASVSAAGSLTLGSEADGINFKHYKVYFNSGTFLGKNPQLTIQIANNATTVKNNLQFGKISMFGSYDPTQRPV